MNARVLKVVRDRDSVLGNIKFSQLDKELLLEALNEQGEINIPVLDGELGRLQSGREILVHSSKVKNSIASILGIFELLRNQEKGQSGVLAIDGRINLFVIMRNGILRLAGVIWKVEGWSAGIYAQGVSLNFTPSTLLFVGKK